MPKHRTTRTCLKGQLLISEYFKTREGPVNMKQRNPTNAGDKSQPAGRISQDTDSLTTLLSDDADLAIEGIDPQ